MQWLLFSKTLWDFCKWQILTSCAYSSFLVLSESELMKRQIESSQKAQIEMSSTFPKCLRDGAKTAVNDGADEAWNSVQRGFLVIILTVQLYIVAPLPPSNGWKPPQGSFLLRVWKCIQWGGKKCSLKTWKLLRGNLCHAGFAIARHGETNRDSAWGVRGGGALDKWPADGVVALLIAFSIAHHTATSKYQCEVTAGG